MYRAIVMFLGHQSSTKDQIIVESETSYNWCAKNIIEAVLKNYCEYNSIPVNLNITIKLVEETSNIYFDVNDVVSVEQLYSGTIYFNPSIVSI